MKKFYYFSKSKLKFVEIKNFYKKFLFLVLFFSLFVSFFIFGTFLVYDEFINPDSEVKSLKKSNAELKKKYEKLLEQYTSLDERVNQIALLSRDLRLAVNLEPNMSIDDFGVGGSVFKPLTSNSPEDLSRSIDEITNYIERVINKVQIENNNYVEIEKKFKENEALYASIPALKPTSGSYTDSFGMRLHPILKIRRMHNGLDIVTDSGTKVIAPGDGKVVFAGYRGGLGTTLEIDHGFGYLTVYGHLESIKVKEGQKVKRGDLIAYTGNSGSLSAGPHLHYEVRHNGIPLNPRNFIYDDVDLFEIVKN